jgi:hypothetical protein
MDVVAALEPTSLYFPRNAGRMRPQRLRGEGPQWQAPPRMVPKNVVLFPVLDADAVERLAG